MKIRKAEESDLAVAAVLMKATQDAHVEAYPHRYVPISLEVAESLLREELESEAEFLVASEGGAICGYAIFEFTDSPDTPALRRRRFCYLRAIGVDTAVKRRGIGKALIENVRAVCKKMDIEEIELDVWAFNEVGRRFFEKIGFEVFGTKMRMSA